MSTAAITSEFQLITALMNCTNSIGPKNTLLALQQAADQHNIAVNFCVNTVLSKMSLSLEDIGRYSFDDQRKVAIGFCVYFLYEVYDINLRRMHEIIPFDLKGTILRNYAKLIRNSINVNPKSDIEFIVALHFKSLEEIFVNHKKTFNTNDKAKQRQTIKETYRQ